MAAACGPAGGAELAGLSARSRRDDAEAGGAGTRGRTADAAHDALRRRLAAEPSPARAGGGLQRRPPSAPPGAAREAAAAGSAAELEGLRQDLEEARAVSAGLTRQLEAGEATRRALEQSLEQERQCVGLLQDQLGRVTEEHRRLAEQHQQRAGELASLARRMEAVQGQVAQLDAVRAERDELLQREAARAGGAAAAAAQARERELDLQRSLEQERARAQRLQTQADAAAAELRRTLEQGAGQHGALWSEVAAATAERDRNLALAHGLRGNLQEALARCAALEAERADLQDQRRAAEARHDAELLGAGEQLKELREHCETLRALRSHASPSSPQQSPSGDLSRLLLDESAARQYEEYYRAGFSDAARSFEARREEVLRRPDAAADAAAARARSEALRLRGAAEVLQQRCLLLEAEQERLAHSLDEARGELRQGAHVSEELAECQGRCRELEAEHGELESMSRRECGAALILRAQLEKAGAESAEAARDGQRARERLLQVEAEREELRQSLDEASASAQLATRRLETATAEWQESSEHAARAQQEWQEAHKHGQMAEAAVRSRLEERASELKAERQPQRDQLVALEARVAVSEAARLSVARQLESATLEGEQAARALEQRLATAESAGARAAAEAAAAEAALQRRLAAAEAAAAEAVRSEEAASARGWRAECEELGQCLEVARRELREASAVAAPDHGGLLAAAAAAQARSEALDGELAASERGAGLLRMRLEDSRNEHQGARRQWRELESEQAGERRALHAQLEAAEAAVEVAGGELGQERQHSETLRGRLTTLLAERERELHALEEHEEAARLLRGRLRALATEYEASEQHAEAAAALRARHDAAVAERDQLRRSVATHVAAREALGRTCETLREEHAGILGTLREHSEAASLLQERMAEVESSAARGAAAAPRRASSPSPASARPASAGPAATTGAPAWLWPAGPPGQAAQETCQPLPARPQPRQPSPGEAALAQREAAHFQQAQRALRQSLAGGGRTPPGGVTPPPQSLAADGSGGEEGSPQVTLPDLGWGAGDVGARWSRRSAQPPARAPPAAKGRAAAGGRTPADWCVRQAQPPPRAASPAAAGAATPPAAGALAGAAAYRWHAAPAASGEGPSAGPRTEAGAAAPSEPRADAPPMLGSPPLAEQALRVLRASSSPSPTTSSPALFDLSTEGSARPSPARTPQTRDQDHASPPKSAVYVYDRAVQSPLQPEPAGKVGRLAELGRSLSKQTLRAVRLAS